MIPFALAMAATVVPNFAAMAPSVSPERTVYRLASAGTAVGPGVAIDGVGVDVGDGKSDEDKGEGEGAPVAAGVAGGAEAGVVAAGSGEDVGPEGAPATRTPPEAPDDGDGASAEGVVVRAITSTRNARTISATRNVWLPARPGVTGRVPDRPRDGSSTSGVALTAGQRSESSTWDPRLADTGPDHLPPAAPYVAQAT